MFTQSPPATQADARLRIVSIAGTRPEAIKLAPVAIAARSRDGLDHRLIATGQHGSLFDDAIACFGIAADRHLAVDWRSGESAVAAALDDELASHRPDLVLVQGDTDSALIAAQAAVRMGIAVGHVEAGLRSFDPASPFPEERNRVAIAQLATLHFAPNARAAANLRQERVSGDIHVTGNSGIDALLMHGNARSAVAAGGPILVTCHRRENYGAPLARICSAILRLANLGQRFIIPLHSNPNSADPIRAVLSRSEAIELVSAMRYHDLIDALRAAPLVMSDSGGLQEECAALGIPLLLLRENTERPEVVESGNCVLVGSNRDAIVDKVVQLMTDPQARMRMSLTCFPYGRGDAALRICDAIQVWQTAPKRIEVG